MQVHSGNFRFELVGSANLELLRQVRNSEELKSFMHHQAEVSSEQQLKWFQTQNPECNLYFLAFKKGQLVGYTLIRNISWKDKSGEPGTFLLHETDRNGSIAALFMMTFLDFCHFVLGIRLFHGNVLDSNARASRNYDHFSKQLVEKTEQGTVYRSSNDTSYTDDTAKIRKALATIFGYRPHFELENIPDQLRPRIPENEFWKLKLTT